MFNPLLAQTPEATAMDGARNSKKSCPIVTFYDFPAEHWKHIRTSNPIESTFATVRHRTKRTNGLPPEKWSSLRYGF